MKIKVSEIKKHHKFQKEAGWCGPAVCQMVLSFSKIKKTQKEIAKDVYKKWWGTGHSILFAYFSRFFKKTGYKNNSTVKDIKKHLNLGHILIVNWWDDFSGKEDADGHYSLLIDLDEKEKKVIFLDPSNERKGVVKLTIKQFEKRWYDYMDIHKKTKIKGYLLWIDPKSKI